MNMAFFCVGGARENSDFFCFMTISVMPHFDLEALYIVHSISVTYYLKLRNAIIFFRRCDFYHWKSFRLLEHYRTYMTSLDKHSCSKKKHHSIDELQVVSDTKYLTWYSLRPKMIVLIHKTFCPKVIVLLYEAFCPKMIVMFLCDSCFIIKKTFATGLNIRGSNSNTFKNQSRHQEDFRHRNFQGCSGVVGVCYFKRHTYNYSPPSMSVRLCNRIFLTFIVS